MIKINGKEIKLNHFPDGTLNLNGQILLCPKVFRVFWKFENNEELVALWFIAKHIESCCPNASKILTMRYCSNARMDRVKNNSDVFTLKYFADMINEMHFDKVNVLDPHSSVTLALINNLKEYDMRNIVKKVDQLIGEEIDCSSEKCVICFPDSNAAKKYEDLFKGCETCYAVKHRDWNTGKITGLEMITNGIDLKDRTVLIWDDIISYGGSMYYVALKLKELGTKRIFAYASHTENSILDKEKGTLIKLLENKTVEKLYTTNSLFTGRHEKIKVIKL